MARTDTDWIGQSLYSLGNFFFKNGQFPVETKLDAELMAINSFNLDILSSLTISITLVHLGKPALHLIYNIIIELLKEIHEIHVKSSYQNINLTLLINLHNFSHLEWK